MAPKAGQLGKMIEKAEELIADMQEKITAGELDAAGEAEATKTIEDVIAKIERLQGLQARLDAVKKSK